MDIFQLIGRAVEAADTEEVSKLLKKAVDEGNDPEEILENGLMAGIEAVGGKFERNEMFIPEVLVSAQTMDAGVKVLRPYLKSENSGFRGKIVLGTVAGDIHDLGKNLVGMMFTANGFQVIDLGVDVAAEDFIAAVDMHKPDFLGISALLTTTMPEMPGIINLLDKQGIRQNDCGCRILVGGAPLSKEFATEIGADCYADNAIEAVNMARSMLGFSS